MTEAAHGGRLRRVVIRSVIVLIVGAAVLVPILYYASTVDSRPPQVQQFVITQHLPGDDAVALTTASLEVQFSEAVDHAGAQASFAIAPAVDGTFTWSGLTMVFTPATRLPLQTDFSVSIRAGVTDRSGNRAGASGPYAFRTVGGPSVVATRPTADATGVPLDAAVQLSFSTLMDTLSVQRALHVTPQTDVALHWNGNQLTIQPVEHLEPDEAYTFVLGVDARDTAGTPLSDALRLTFTTVRAGLTVRAMIPADRTQGIAVTSPVAVVFDRAIDPTTVNDRLLTIHPAVPGSVSLTTEAGVGQGAARRVVRFTPSGTLPANTTFTVTLATSVHGGDGGLLPVPLTWTFTTGSPSATLGNQVVFLSTRSGVANLWAMNPDGSNQHQVSAELSSVTGYAVAPDGRTFVVEDGTRLVEQRADGSNRRILTQQGAVEFDPSFSPDGASIVFGRADAVSGGGLGLWRRPTQGGTSERVVIRPASSPSPATSSSSPSPSSSPNAAPAPLLRAPRFSEDGSRLAFVDMSGSVGIVDLRDGSLTTARFAAAAPPAWLPDGSTALFSGLAAAPSGGLDGGSGTLDPGTAVAPLTPAGLGLGEAQRQGLRLAQLAVGSQRVTIAPLPTAASLPAVDAGGRVAYVLLEPQLADAGRAWVGTATAPASQLELPGAGFESRVSFAPRPDTLVVTRVVPPGPPSPEPDRSPGASASPTPSPGVSPSPGPPPGTAESAAGIWLVNTTTGASLQLSPDGWLAAWLP